jgi:hypothetical protein
MPTFLTKEEKVNFNNLFKFSLLATFALIVSVLVHTFFWTKFSSKTTAVVQADRPSCKMQMSTFKDYPLYYAGDTYEGLPLTDCIHVVTAAKTLPDGTVYEPAMDYWNLYYGDCDPGKTGCSPPIQVTVDSPCNKTVLADAVKSGTVTVRSVAATIKTDNSIRIETPSYKVSIWAFGKTRSEKVVRAVGVANSLRGANDQGATVQAGQAFTEGLVKKVCS